MITDKSRDYYIGASDTHFVMMNFDTKTFQRWWQVKIGADENEIESVYTIAGNIYEQRILDEIFVPYRNEQFIVGQLRVNLDGRTDQEVVEVKTSKKPYTKVRTDHWQQTQVEMFASCMTKARLVAYEMEEADYEYIRDIDLDRLKTFTIEYDEDWVLNEYMPRFNYLTFCFNEEVAPSNDGFNEWKGVMNGY